MNAPLIALLTDFGTTDPFVGIMKGVIASITPGTPTVDLTHEIPAGDIRKAAITLWMAAPYFPDGTVFLCVVDPGVGTQRLPMILQTGSVDGAPARTFIGPDNGLFTFTAQRGFQAWQLANPRFMLPAPGKTFHGRDIFAPAAAHAARGVAGSAFGPAITSPVQLPLPLLEWRGEDELIGEVLYPDRFGNLLTSLGVFQRIGKESFLLKPWRRGLPPDGIIAFTPWIRGLPPAGLAAGEAYLTLPDGKRLRLANTFGEIPAGKCAAIIGSSGLLEIAANRQSAADLLRLSPGDQVILTASRIQLE